MLNEDKVAAHRPRVPAVIISQAKRIIHPATKKHTRANTQCWLQLWREYQCSPISKDLFICWHTSYYISTNCGTFYNWTDSSRHNTVLHFEAVNDPIWLGFCQWLIDVYRRVVILLTRYICMYRSICLDVVRKKDVILLVDRLVNLLIVPN